jgi:hypothetical protein
MEPKNLNSAKQRYLSRKGYDAVLDQQYVFARKATLGKAVAFYDGTFNRDAFVKVYTEAKQLGLTAVTILVNGLATYSGGSFNVIRIDDGCEPSTIGEGIQDDFMSDTRLAKKVKAAMSFGT